MDLSFLGREINLRNFISEVLSSRTFIFLLLLRGPMRPVRLLLHLGSKEVLDLTVALLLENTRKEH